MGEICIKKLISLICAAALLLTGCGRNGYSDIPSFSFEPKSSSSSESKPVTSGSTISEGDTEPHSETSETSDTSETSTSAPVIGEPRTLVLSHDPINEKSIEIDGDVMTVTARTSDNSIENIYASENCVTIDIRLNANGFTAVIRLTDPSYDSVDITFGYDDGISEIVYFKIGENGFEPYDLSNITEDNTAAAEKTLTQPENQVAEYIVEGGDAKEIRKVMDEIQELSDEICGGINNDYDRLRAIERWVAANVYYDYPAYDMGIPAETLSLRYILDNHSSVCGGYSNMVSALCAAQGIKCWNVHGSAITNGRTFALSDDGVYHEWNFAEVYGRIIWLDACWDSYCTLSRDGEYNNGGIGYRYFDIGAEYFATNHHSNYAEYRDYFALLK